MYFNSNSNELYSWLLYWRYVSVVSNTVFVQTRRPTMTWTVNDQILRCYMASLSHDGLIVISEPTLNDVYIYGSYHMSILITNNLWVRTYIWLNVNNCFFFVHDLDDLLNIFTSNEVTQKPLANRLTSDKQRLFTISHILKYFARTKNLCSMVWTQALVEINHWSLISSLFHPLQHSTIRSPHKAVNLWRHANAWHW